MPPPLIFAALLFAKKVAGVAAYNQLRAYGVPRAYRRALEANSRLTPAPQRKPVASALKAALRAPGNAAYALMSSPVLRFLQGWIAERDPFLVEMGKSLMDTTPGVTPLVKEVVGLAAEGAKRSGGAKLK